MDALAVADDDETEGQSHDGDRVTRKIGGNMGFHQIYDYFGVDTAVSGTPSIMVPVNDYNLIVVDSSGDLSMKWERGGPARAEDVTDYVKKNVTVAHQHLTDFVKHPLMFARSMVLLSAATSMQLGQQKRVIAITSPSAGDFDLSVAGSKLTVAARNKRTVTLSFWIYQYTGTLKQDEWRALGGALNGNAHSKYLVEGLEKYFGPQANVYFERKGVTDWKTNLWPSPDLNRFYDRPIFDHKYDGEDYSEQIRGDVLALGAEIAVFVVPSISGGGENAFHVPGTSSPAGINSVWVPWTYQHMQTIATISNGTATYSDPQSLFIPEICHEVTHALGGDHKKRYGLMCHDADRSDGSYLAIELLIDKDRLDTVNPATSAK